MEWLVVGVVMVGVEVELFGLGDGGYDASVEQLVEPTTARHGWVVECLLHPSVTQEWE